MYNITETAKELKFYYASKETPYPVFDNDYTWFVVRAVKRYYVDRNQPYEFDQELFVRDDKDELYYDHDFDIVQQEYIFILAKIEYKRNSLGDVTGDKAVSYTTNALSVSGAKEAYKSIQIEIDDLEKERRIVFHKMMAREEG